MKGKGGFGEDFRWMVLGEEEKGGGVVVDFVVGREVGEGVKRFFGGGGGSLVLITSRKRG